jgi:hypothetical protein
MGSSKKKKKAAAAHASAQQLLQQWSDSRETVIAREEVFKTQVRETMKRQLSRKQRRSAAAAWADTSPERAALAGSIASADEAQTVSNSQPGMTAI